MDFLGQRKKAEKLGAISGQNSRPKFVPVSGKIRDRIRATKPKFHGGYSRTWTSKESFYASRKAQGPVDGGVSNGGASQSGFVLVCPSLSLFAFFGAFEIFL